jgi:hypothetical protein
MMRKGVWIVASQSTLVGAAGEHYVMAKLLRCGYIAALAPRGVPNIDIVVTDLEGSRSFSIQVKARRDIGSDGGWHLNEKHERLRDARLFYCLVDFGKSEDALPKVYVVPSRIIADILTQFYQMWLTTPGKKGQPHKPTKMRRLLPNYSHIFGAANTFYPHGWLNKYEDAWDLLKLESTALGTESGD